MIRRPAQLIVVLALVATAAEAQPVATPNVVANQFGVQPLPELLAAEIQLMAEVCELPPEQIQMLREETRKAMQRWGGTMEEAALVKAMRRELVLLLKNISPPAYNRFSSEWLRLEERERRAACMVQISALDTSLVLTSGQRQALVESMPTPAAWQPETTRPIRLLRPGAPELPDALSGGGLQQIISEPQLTAVVRPTQLATFQQFHILNLQRTGILRKGVRQWMIVNQPRLDDQRRRLTTLLDRFIEYADAACHLNETQRTKLRLAGRLDIEGFTDRYGEVETRGDGSTIEQWFRLTMLSDNAFAIFSARGSRFRKLQWSGLDDQQKKSLAAAEAERLTFHREAIVQAVVVGLQRSAALTADECEALASLFNDALADSRSTIGHRSSWVRAITEVHAEKIKTVLDNQKWPAVQRQLAQLWQVVEHLEWQESPAP